MVEPLFRTDFVTPPVAGLAVTLGGSEGKHAVNVRRMRVGEGIQLSDGKGLRVRGKVSALGNSSLTVAVEQVEQEAIPAIGLTIIQALAKGDRDELAIQAATELGCWSVIPWQADRSISKWEGAKVAKSVERWQTIVSEAAKQSLRVFEPIVAQPVSSKQLSVLVKDFDLVLVLDPTSDLGLGQIALDAGDKSVAVVVGPEGGISEHELELFAAAGAKRVHLGQPILRTSTAGVAAIAVIQAKLGLWG
ncbi:MAG: 16S rRNA (uracil(1498)-N(3))-methyltransferase [Rhodoluna sp.]